jgi:adenosylmethionine-8-amino-7-oxononanoate aminotransferase
LKDLEDTIIEEGAESILAFIVESVGGLATGGWLLQIFIIVPYEKFVRNTEYY